MARARLSARWVLTGEDDLGNGAVLIGDDGSILAAGYDAEVPSPPGCPRHDYGEAVILPGLVNFHTHLELTGLNGGQALDDPHFPTWIRRLRELKAQRTRADFLAAAREGVRQCFRQGVTMIADTGDTGVVPEVMAGSGMRGVVYHEVFGPDPVLVKESMRALEQAVEQLMPWQSERVVIGVSPHAPYTVSGPLYREACRWSRERGLPLAVHIAESAEESALLSNGSGAFADAWRRRNLPMPEPLGLTPVSYLDYWEVWGAERDNEDSFVPCDVLAIHAVRVPSDDLKLLRRTGTMVAWCPVANRAHGHGDSPVPQPEAGIVYGLGTDSELSVGPIDLLAVAGAAQALIATDARAVITTLSLNSVELPGGWVNGEPRAGLVLPGQPADLAVFACAAGQEPADAILAARNGAALATWAAGTEVYRLTRAEGGVEG